MRRIAFNSFFRPARLAGMFARGFHALAAAAVIGLVPCLSTPAAAETERALRIVSAAPSVTEILFELGLGPDIVGVTAACDFPEAAKRIAGIGPYDQPNVEKVLSLSPTLLIAANANLSSAKGVLDHAGIRVLNVKIGNFEQLFSAIRSIGEATRAEPQAEQLVARLQGELDSVRPLFAQVPETRRPKVFVELWNNPLTTAGQNSFVSEAIVRAGGVNCAQAIRQDYPQVSAEAVLDWNPDFILIARMLPSPHALEDIRGRIGWNQIRAVRDNRLVHNISSDYLLRPGPRLVLGVRLLAEKLYAPFPEETHAP